MERASVQVVLMDGRLDRRFYTARIPSTLLSEHFTELLTRDVATSVSILPGEKWVVRRRIIGVSPRLLFAIIRALIQEVRIFCSQMGVE